jgi:hypothetical protein
MNKKEWFIDFFLPLPAIIVGAIFIFFLFEILPLRLIIPALIVTPIDVTIPVSFLQSVQSFDGRSFFQYELFTYAAALTVISFILRSVIAYHIARIIIRRFNIMSSILEKNAYDKTYSAISKTYGLANLLPFSFLIMGLPIDLIVSLFFYQSFAELFSLDLASLTLILLLVDILRMSVLTLLVPRLRKINVIKLEVYGAAVAIILCGIFFLCIGFIIAKNLFSVFHIVLESLIVGINQTNLTFFILFVSPIIIGILHIYYGWLIVAITQIGNNFGYLHRLHFSAWYYFCCAIY